MCLSQRLARHDRKGTPEALRQRLRCRGSRAALRHRQLHDLPSLLAPELVSAYLSVLAAAALSRRVHEKLQSFLSRHREYGVRHLAVFALA